MTSTTEIVASAADAAQRKAFWEAKGPAYTVTVDSVGVFTVYDRRVTPSQLVMDTTGTPPQWLVRVMIDL